MNTFYKLVRKHYGTGELWSWGTEHYAVRYPIGKRVLAPGKTKLFVFDSLQNATGFHGNDFWEDRFGFGYLGIQIWECEAENPTRVSLVADSFLHYHAFWEGGVVPLGEAPKGTMLCDSVVLKKRIY